MTKIFEPVENAHVEKLVQVLQQVFDAPELKAVPYTDGSHTYTVASTIVNDAPMNPTDKLYMQGFIAGYFWHLNTGG